MTAPKLPVHIMGFRIAVVVIIQAILTLLAIVTSASSGLPWIGTAAVAVLGAMSIARVLPTGVSLDVYRWCIAVSWAVTFVIPAATLLQNDDYPVTLEKYLSKYFAVLSWLLAATMLPAVTRRSARQVELQWKIPVIVWAGFGSCVIWLGAAYAYNQRIPFLAGVLATATVLAAALLWFRMPIVAVQAVTTLILLLVGLPLADLLVRPPARLDKDLAPEKRYYSYAVARKDPAGFANWWALFCAEFDDMGRKLYITDPEQRVPYKTKPGAEALLFQCRVRINSRGFRGKEITEPKSNTLRIVCLGESTTFGCTLRQSDRPWPELLESMIREHLDLQRPVEVINAGLPSFTLENNLARIESDILPLKPDLVICYHGYNGFNLLHSSFAPSRVEPPPQYVLRPLRLLALCEHRLKLLAYRRGLTARLRREPPVVTNLMQTAYAKAYEQLIGIARTNGIRLVLGTHCMAVNPESDPDVIEFYRPGFPAVHWQIQANRLHSQLLGQLAMAHPEIKVVDTSPNLDGHHDQFIDLVHFTQSGREQLATNFFSAIKNELTSEFSAQKPGHASWGSD